MKHDSFRRYEMTAAEALNFVATTVDAASTWEQLKKHWKPITDLRRDLREAFRFRNNMRGNRKLSPGNIKRRETLLHVQTRIKLLADNYLLRRKENPMSPQELKHFMADWETISDPYRDKALDPYPEVVLDLDDDKLRYLDN